MLLNKLAINSKFLTALTFATVTFLSFTSIAKAENAAQSDVNPPESTAVIQDKTQTATDTSSQSATVDSPKATLRERNSTQAQADATNRDPKSSSDNYEHKCGEQ
jgi:hypothetical protein